MTTPLDRLRAADPAADAPTPDPRYARAMLDRILAEPPAAAHRPHRRLVAAGVVGVAAAAAVSAGVLTTPWSHGRPAAAAYAVTRQDDGAVGVTVRWDELRDPAALNAELAAQGARTVVMRESADGGCRTGFALDPRYSLPAFIKLPGHPDPRDPDRVTALLAYLRARSPWIDSRTNGVFTIHPDKIPAGDTLLVPYQFVTGTGPQNGDVMYFSSMLVPEVPLCVPSSADTVRTSTEVRVR